MLNVWDDQGQYLEVWKNSEKFFLKSFAQFTRKYLFWSLFLNKVSFLMKLQVLKNSFLKEHLRLPLNIAFIDEGSDSKQKSSKKWMFRTM